MIHKAEYDRLKTERDRRYGVLMAAAHVTGCDALIMTVELHAPEEISTHYPTHPECLGCFGTVQGSGPWWPEDCQTTMTIAGALKVDLS